MLSLAQLLLMPNIMGVDMVATAVDMVAIAVDMVAMDVDTERGLLMPSLAMDMDMPEDMDMAEDMDMDTMDKWMIILRVLDTVTILVKL